MFLSEPWMDDQARRQPRRRVLFMSSVTVRTVAIPCKVRDVSVSGALIETTLPLWQDTKFTLALPKIGNVEGEVAWIDGLRSGVVFNAMLDPLQIREMLEEKPKSGIKREAADAPRWQRPQVAVESRETQDRSRGAVAWLRQQKQDAKG
jgi:PilZ domain